MNSILYLILLPIVAGLLCIIINRKLFSEIISVVLTICVLVLSIVVFLKIPELKSEFFLIDSINRFIVPFIGLFGFLIVLYSLKFMSNLNILPARLNDYYTYILWTLGAAFGAVLSNNLILLLVFWGFLGMTLYLLIQISTGSEDKLDNPADIPGSAKKTFIIIGGSDCFMILGIAIIWSLTGTFQMDKININLMMAGKLPAIAFLCLVIASFAKAGAMPFHTWIPDISVTAPVPVTAYLPASLDKLLGIYLLARVFMNMFTLNSQLSILIMVLGSITIIAAVFMAMIQHDLKKLLSYHAVSQVGYMVLGIGTGNPIGIAGGVFHMLNHAIYKSCLFLCGGSVEHKTGTSDLDKLGGLAKVMPITFITFLIAAFSISGVPPFNGFVSKWMVYQGIIQRASVPGPFSVIKWLFLISAMFGSALTLASFMKLIHAVFLGTGLINQTATKGNVASQFIGTSRDVHWTMQIPQIVLALLCIIFGIFAFQIPLKYFIPVPAYFSGIWQPGLATTLIVVGLIAGLIIYRISGSKHRETDTFIGGEPLPEEVRVTGTDFYQTIKDMGFFKSMYILAENKFFDIYNWGKNIVLSCSTILSAMHTGRLPTYLFWCLIGVAILLFMFIKG